MPSLTREHFTSAVAGAHEVTSRWETSSADPYLPPAVTRELFAAHKRLIELNEQTAQVDGEARELRLAIDEHRRRILEWLDANPQRRPACWQWDAWAGVVRLASTIRIRVN
jgi:hypothetical protein